MEETCNPEMIKTQVNRTEGQVLGIGRMIEAGRSCDEVLQQIVAARASLQKLGQLLLQAKAQGCFGSSPAGTSRVKELEQVVSNLFKIT